MLSNNIQKLANSAGNLDISVKKLSLVETQEITTKKTIYNVNLTGDENITWGQSSIYLTKDSSNTTTIIPSEGYVLESITCTNGYTASYENSSSSEQTVTINNNGNESDSVCTASSKKVISLGSYVTYEPTETSYTASASNTGSSSDSTLNPSELTSWRVLKINDDGTVDIVSTYVSSSKLTFYGKIGYINFVNELEKAAAAYVNSTYAVSARSLGYGGQTLVITDTTALEQTTTIPWTSETLDNSNEAEGGGDTLYLTDINQMTTAGISLTTTTPSGTSEGYWLASRYYYYNSSNLWYFFGRYVSTGGSIDDDALYYYSRGMITCYSDSYALRPVVTLRSTVKISGGSGTVADPYTLSV